MSGPCSKRQGNMVSTTSRGTSSNRVTFDPDKRDVSHQSGDTLLTTAQKHGIKIASACGGRGICKTCVIRFVDGDIPEASDSDRHFFSAAKTKKGWRRACQIHPEANCKVHVPARARADSARMQVDGADFWVAPEPLVTSVPLNLSAPTLDDKLADADRVMLAINNESGKACRSIDADVLRSLSRTLRQETWKAQAVVRCGEVISVQEAKTRLIGLAVDLGTSNIGVFLIDLQNGTTLASLGIENPQGIYGSDVIARVGAAAISPESAREMHRLVIDAINEGAKQMCKQHHLVPGQIADVVVAANTAMHHLFLELPVKGLGLAPFAPVITAAMDIKASQLGLHTAAGAYIHMMPNIAGFVGGDHAAMLLGICADTEKRTIIALDIGTNTEITLVHKGQLLSLSCPSGPALEGGHISCGMRAATGAIEGVSLANDTIKLKVLGDAIPSGLCGSAVVDTVAAFYQAGGINQRGQIIKKYVHAVKRNEERCILLYEGEQDVVFTQKDIRSVQLAKGAVRAGIDLLLETAGIDCDQLEKIVVAGAFGNYIRIESAIAIGLFPDLPPDYFEQVGNAAGIGAKLALLSLPQRDKASLLAGRSQYIVQAGNPGFNDMFIRSLNFPAVKSLQE